MPTAVPRKSLAKGSKVYIGLKAGGVAGATLFGRIETCQLPPTIEFTVAEDIPELNPQDNSGNPLSADPSELTDQTFGTSQLVMYSDAMHTQEVNLRTWAKAKETLIFRVESPHTVDAFYADWEGQIQKLLHEPLSKTNYFKLTIDIINRTELAFSAKP